MQIVHYTDDEAYESQFPGAGWYVLGTPHGVVGPFLTNATAAGYLQRLRSRISARPFPRDKNAGRGHLRLVWSQA